MVAQNTETEYNKVMAQRVLKEPRIHLKYTIAMKVINDNKETCEG